MAQEKPVTYRRTGTQGKLILRGIVDIFEAEGLHKTALRALHDGSATTLLADLSATERLDISALQILCALKLATEEVGKTMLLTGASAELETFFAAAGITYIWQAAGKENLGRQNNPGEE